MMKCRFKGKWRVLFYSYVETVTLRVVIEGASVGNGIYPMTWGQDFDVDGKDYWSLEIQEAHASGTWHKLSLEREVFFDSPLAVSSVIRTSKWGPLVRVLLSHQGPLIEIPQKPFAVDASTFAMIPGGIFEAAAGIQYMGVRVKNIWELDLLPDVMVQISNEGKQILLSRGIEVLDSWSNQELEALGQEVNGDAVWVSGLRQNQSRIIYFKLDCSGASPGKPQVPIVAKRTVWDPVYEELERTVFCQIYVSNSHWDPYTGEVVVGVPEATLRMRVKRATVEPKGFWKAVREAKSKGCLDAVTKLKGASRPTGSAGLREELRGFLQDLLEGKHVDPCKLRELMELCCHDKFREPTKPRDTHLPRECSTFNPFYMLLDEFEYTIEYSTPFEGKYGPLAFEDPWWKVVILVLALVQIIIAIVLGFLAAVREAKAQGDIVIGRIHKIEPPNNGLVDAAVIALNDNRGRDFGVLDTSWDDISYLVDQDLESPQIYINELDGAIPLNRSDNGNRGIADAEPGMVVFKSGARTGLTFGIVESVEYSDWICYAPDGYCRWDSPDLYGFDKLIKILGGVDVDSIKEWIQSEEDLDLSSALYLASLPGDSGSVWVDLETKRVVGLHFASGGLSDATANHIGKVVDKLKIQFNSP